MSLVCYGCFLFHIIFLGVNPILLIFFCVSSWVSSRWEKNHDGRDHLFLLMVMFMGLGLAEKGSRSRLVLRYFAAGIFGML